MMSYLAVLILALLVEGIMENLGQPIARNRKRYFAAGLGVLICLCYGADILAPLGLEARYPYVGEILTGLIIGRGSNFLHDFWKRMRGEPMDRDPTQMEIERALVLERLRALG